MENIEIHPRPLDEKTHPLADTQVAKVPAYKVLGEEASADTFELGSMHTNYNGSSSTGIKCPFREESINFPWESQKRSRNGSKTGKCEKKEEK
jgi:hypothetical protein